MINETAIPAPIGTAKNAGDATNFDRMPTAGFAASIAPSRASFSSLRSPSDSSVSASSPPPSERKNDCILGNASSFVAIRLCLLSEIVLIDNGLHDTELCFVTKNARHEQIEAANKIAVRAVIDGNLTDMAAFWWLQRGAAETTNIYVVEKPI